MLKVKKNQPPDGQLRQSQLVTTYGPGAMMDLPDYSVIIGGLEYWHSENKQLIREERLERYICEKLNMESIKLYAPPPDEESLSGKTTGIEAHLFPLWFLAQLEKTDEEEGQKKAPHGYKTRRLVPWESLIQGQYLTAEKKKRPVVPVRFVQACPNGHLRDLEWDRFVHHGQQKSCKRSYPRLWLDEGGSGGDFSEIFVRCDCGTSRPLSDTKIPHSKVLGECQGERPWLGERNREPCVNLENGKPHDYRLLVRSASNAYFAQTLSVISIPEANKKVKEAVDRVFENYLQYAESIEDIARERRKTPVAVSLEGLTNEQVWEEVKRRSTSKAPEIKGIKQAEIETLLSSPVSVGENIPNGNFYARTRPTKTLPEQLKGKVDSVILVDRLREVIAQVGFTRFEASMTDVEGELDLNIGRAALAKELYWVPAVENRGEGVLITFQTDAIHSWLKREPVKKRGERLIESFYTWREQRNIPNADFPGIPYIMLHSLSHLLITAVSLDCGYAASSIRERIYAGDYGYGILLYTGTSGSEGTLGGLVQIGHHIEEHLLNALEMGKLCSNDPVCAEHDPTNKHEERFLHGSACHACLLIAEPSCEKRNSFLDRMLVVDTVNGSGAAFF